MSDNDRFFQNQPIEQAENPFEQAENLRQSMNNIPPEQQELRNQARQALHDFLEQHPEMGGSRYQIYLGQDGPDNLMQNPNI